MISLRQNRGGYTIIEVMIVLAVSAALFAAAITGYINQNRRTQFSESVQTFAQNLQDLINDNDTGYYSSKENFGCTAGNIGFPTVTSSAASRGTNSSCVFLGKALQLAPTDNSSAYDALTVVGRRLKEHSQDVASTLSEAKPVAIEASAERRVLSGGVEFKSIKVHNESRNVSVLGIVADSGSADVNNYSGFNTRSVLVGIKNASIGQDRGNFISSIANLGLVKLNRGVDICLEEIGGGRTAVVTVGGSDVDNLSIKTEIDKDCS